MGHRHLGGLWLHVPERDVCVGAAARLCWSVSLRFLFMMESALFVVMFCVSFLFGTIGVSLLRGRTDKFTDQANTMIDGDEWRQVSQGRRQCVFEAASAAVEVEQVHCLLLLSEAEARRMRRVLCGFPRESNVWLHQLHHHQPRSQGRVLWIEPKAKEE